ncbi:helix-turn-helix domain-containing protein [Paenirhodobacter populi]|uniref:XRE family transcriptional regulator n=1 Tax=Paenirhodobacter populi TaxID=2306993 RepID=A0A443KM29_9RHOB|nr:short-chain fatty acyl-CoA regulator family protein [Sinirhodobacter populi]RWR08299.1 XRE family transcriptional regulator [Sinirhodobacter populi]RWR22110.1 XRE family transcriptional regulator [Sinirhodobacter populi]RWR33815.1 XRE family transcriptional regulator [Sinirhodobacter populi]
MSERGEKLVIGARLKRLRKTLGLTQAQMAQDLDVSPSYITLIEANQRPISAKLLLKLSQVYDFAPRDIAGGQDLQLQAELEAALKDPVFAETIPRSEVEDVVNASPALARALLRLHDRYRTMAMAAISDKNPLSDREKVEMLEQTARPVEEVRAHLHARNNHIDALDRAAEALSEELEMQRREPHIVLSARLRDRHGFRVRILPQDVMPEKLRLIDPHRKHLNLSERLEQTGRRFQIAVLLARLEYGDLIEKEAEDFSPEARPLARAAFANYFAAALLMPYKRFLQNAESERYDIELLGQRFGTSYEQVAHRLTTLQRPEARGVPFFFVRMDQAGNVSKRFSAGRFHFSKFGGSCPLWNIHSCFEVPGRVQTQVIAMPDGTTYFSIARTVARHIGNYSEPAAQFAIGLGCDIAYAPRLVYARGLNLEAVTPVRIGVNCYLCERQNCGSRAYPPINRPFRFSERERGVSSFHFEVDEE